VRQNARPVLGRRRQSEDRRRIRPDPAADAGVHGSGPKQAPGQVQAGWRQVAEDASQVLRHGGSLLKACNGEIHQAWRLHEDLDQGYQALLGRKRALSRPWVVVGAGCHELGAAQSAEDAFTGKRIEEASRVADESVPGSGRPAHPRGQRADTPHGARQTATL
jgi:hypothetical protein